MSLETSYALTFESIHKTASAHGMKSDPFRAGASTLDAVAASLSDSGTGATLLTKHYHKQLTLVSTVAQTINLFAHTDEFGTAQSMTLVKLAWFRVVTPVTGVSVELAGNATAAWMFEDPGQALTVKNLLFRADLIDGWVVSNSTKNIDFTSAGGNCVLDVYFGGT